MQAAITANHPVAGDNNGYRVVPQRLPDRAAGLWLADRLRHLLIRPDHSCRNAESGLQHAALERRDGLHVKGEVEHLALLQEVLAELRGDMGQCPRIAL